MLYHFTQSVMTFARAMFYLQFIYKSSYMSPTVARRAVELGAVHCRGCGCWGRCDPDADRPVHLLAEDEGSQGHEAR